MWATEPERRSSPLLLPAGWIVLLLPWAWLVRRFWFVSDDAYISFRYARNLANGFGLRYNPAENPPVEGYSNFLWVAVAALFERLRLGMETVPLLLSAACGALLLFLVLRLLLRRFRLHPLSALLGALLLAASPPFGLWATGGLETMPFTLLLFLAAERMLLRRGGPAVAAGALAALGAALIRTEGIFWAAGIGGLAFLLGDGDGRENRRGVIRFFAILFIGYAAYFAARTAYFGEPLANTAYVKAGFGAAVLRRGLRYVVSFFLVFLAPLLALPGLVAAGRIAGYRTALALAALIGANLAYAAAVGGDWMAMGRILLPGAAVFGAIAAAFLFEAIRGRGGAARTAGTVLLGGAALAAGVLPAFNAHVLPRAHLERFDFRYHARAFRTEYEQWEHMAMTPAIWTAYGKHLKRVSSPGESCVCGAIGAIGYYSDLFVYDLNGLVTPSVAKREGVTEDRSPGHDKRVPLTFFMEERPTYILYVMPMTDGVIQSHARNWRRGEYGEEYGAVKVPLRTGGGPGSGLLYLRRLGPEEDPEEAWTRFFDGSRGRRSAPAEKPTPSPRRG